MKTIAGIGSLVALLLLMTSCSHRDCQGHKHHVKTEMGGYL